MAQAIPVIMVAATVASTAVAAYSAYSSGRAQRNAAEYNARLLEQQAAQEREAADIRAENYRKAAQAKLARMRGSILASGITMEGTPLLVMMESEKEAKLDELRIRAGGEASAAGLLGSATLEKMRGSEAQTAGYFAAGSSLLSGAGRSARQYYTAYGKGGGLW